MAVLIKRCANIIEPEKSFIIRNKLKFWGKWNYHMLSFEMFHTAIKNDLICSEEIKY
jgi:hypothetical protein